MDATTVYSDIELLHPVFRYHVVNLMKELEAAYKSGTSKVQFRIFETFRSPVRQIELRRKGVSKAGEWNSPHQYGLAVDFVPYLTKAQAAERGVKPGWHWPEASDECWVVLEACAEKAGLVRPINWDKPHIEAPWWQMVRKANK